MGVSIVHRANCALTNKFSFDAGYLQGLTMERKETPSSKRSIVSPCKYSASNENLQGLTMERKETPSSKRSLVVRAEQFPWTAEAATLTR